LATVLRELDLQVMFY